MKKTTRFFLLLFILVAGLGFDLSAQTKSQATKPEYELTGNLSFDIMSMSGKVTRISIRVGDGGTGPFKAVMTNDATLPTHTIFRPEKLNKFGGNAKLPVVAFANGGCRNSSGEFRNFLSEIASHGFLVISIGPITNTMLGGGEMAVGATESKQLLDAVDWAIKENSRPESIFFQKIDIEKVAVMGQSCGGLQALAVSSDPRVTTTVILNSGAFKSTGQQSKFLPAFEKSDLKKLHASVAYFVGGESDMATQNAEDDYKWLDQVPVIVASYDFSDKVKETGNKGIGHYPATYRNPNGGDFAVAAVAWLKWQLKGDQAAGKIFAGNPCGLEKNPRWKVNKKNID